jgi:hypothetical protein
MSDSYLQLLAHLSKSVEAGFDLPLELAAKLAGKFGGEEGHLRCVHLLSSQAATVWVKGESVAEHLVANKVGLDDSLTVTFEYVRNQPSYLVEIAPKKKNTAMDLKKFDKVFNDLKGSFSSVSCLLVSDFRIVVKFAGPEEAARHCSAFVEPMKEDGLVSVTCRVVLLKEHMVMRAFYVGGSQPFSRYAVKHSEIHGQSMTDLVHSKFSHFKDRPVALEVSGFAASSTASTGRSESAEDVPAGEEVNIVCATNFDYRLLRNAPPVVLPNNAGSLVLRMSTDQKARKAGEKEESVPVPPLRMVGPPALPPPPNLPHPTSATTSSAPSPSGPAPAQAYIFW